MNSTHPPAPVGAKKVCLWGGTNNRSAFSREWVQNTVSWGAFWAHCGFLLIFAPGGTRDMQMCRFAFSLGLIWRRVLSWVRISGRKNWANVCKGVGGLLAGNLHKITAAYTNVQHVDHCKHKHFGLFGFGSCIIARNTAIYSTVAYFCMFYKTQQIPPSFLNRGDGLLNFCIRHKTKS